jgi:hypothetical protein
MLKDDELPKDVPPMLPGASPGEPVYGDPNNPGTMEQLFNPRNVPEPEMPAAGGRTAMAGKNVPLPERGGVEDTSPMETVPARGERPMQGLVKTDDTRYKDPQNLLMGNVIMGGMLPWAQAAADVASGRVPKEKFDEVRMEHQRKLEELADQHPDFVSAAQKAVPFLEGLGMSMVKPASTVVGTMGRGAAVAAPGGAARGYSSGPVEEPSASSNRAAAAVGGAATDSAIGATGAAVPALVQGGKTLIGKVTSVVAERAARKAEGAAVKQLDGEATKVAGRKPLSPEEAKKADKEFTARTKQHEAKLTEDYKRHTAMPDKPSKYWEENRKVFVADPVHAFNEAASSGADLAGMSKILNLPPAVIAARLGGKKIKIETPQQEKLMNDIIDASESLNDFSKRGLKAPKAATAAEAPAPKPAETPAAAAKPAKAAKKPKAEAAEKPAKAKPRSNQRSDDNPYGEGYHTVTRSRKKK